MVFDGSSFSKMNQEKMLTYSGQTNLFGTSVNDVPNNYYYYVDEVQSNET